MGNFLVTVHNHSMSGLRINHQGHVNSTQKEYIINYECTKFARSFNDLPILGSAVNSFVPCKRTNISEFLVAVQKIILTK